MVALLSLHSWCLVMVVWLFLAVPWVCLRFVIMVFPDHTNLPFLLKIPFFKSKAVGWSAVCDCGFLIPLTYFFHGEGLTSWLSYVMSYREVVTSPLVSWVRCDA